MDTVKLLRIEQCQGPYRPHLVIHTPGIQGAGDAPQLSESFA